MSRSLKVRFNSSVWPFSALEKDYQSISPSKKSNDNTEDDGLRTRGSQHNQSLLQVITGILFISLLTLSVMYIQLLIKTMPLRLYTCGNSLSEARALNCTFDELSKSWLPSICPRYGAEGYASEKYQYGNNDGNWHYYTDEEGTEEYTLEEMAGLAENRSVFFWTTRREHAHHCMWVMTRMAHVFQNDERRDQLMRQFSHAKHCVKLLLDMALEGADEDYLDGIAVQGDVGLGYC